MVSAPEGKQVKLPTKQEPTNSTNPNVPLFKLLGEIRDAIKESTEAVNSLLTTVVGQTRGVSIPALAYKKETLEEGKKVDVGHTMEEQAGVGAVKPVMPPNTVKQPFPQPLSEPEPSQIESVKMMFPEDLENLLTFTDEGDHIKVKPRQFLGSDNFAKIASVIRAANGEYVSAGKESHFRVPKK